MAADYTEIESAWIDDRGFTQMPGMWELCGSEGGPCTRLLVPQDEVAPIDGDGRLHGFAVVRVPGGAVVGLRVAGAGCANGCPLLG